MNRNYRSIYGKHIEQFINLKRKLGFKYTTGATILKSLDSMADQRKESSPDISKDFADKWCEKRPNESKRYHYERIRYLIIFSSYLCDIGILSYQPRLPPYPNNTFIPHIFSQEEINAIFMACDNLKAVKVGMRSPLISIPALIRVLYCTGIRINEALALTDEDVNLIDGQILIKDSKNGKERIIPISTSLVKVCKDYLHSRDKLPLYRKSKHFFITLQGKRCSYLGVYGWFRKCLEAANIPFKGGKHGPRIHDLRHTFAVTSLVGMAEEGMDLYVSLPILSTYLGHQSIQATEHYLRLTANMHPDLIRDVDLLCLDVFPKFQ